MTRRTLAVLATSTLLLAGCGGTATPGSGSGGGSTGAGTGGGVSVIVGFYPLQYAVERIGGDRVQVTNLTKPGAEPHDLELTTKDVATVSEADVVVYEKGLQPAVDQAVTSQQVEHQLDVATVARLDVPPAEPVAEVEGGTDEHDHAGEPTGDQAHESGGDHAEETGGGHDHDHDHGGVDPHFWLDPVRYGEVAKAIAQELTKVDPDGASTYQTNLDALTKDLTGLHAEYTKGLATCTNKNLVTSHAAFGYLAERYGLEQAAISGLSPEQEPDPRRLAAVADYAKKNKVTTIYAETLSSPAVAETVARETGAQTAVLDPIEGLTEEGTDYLSIMRTNLGTLRKGQSCS